MNRDYWPTIGWCSEKPENLGMSSALLTNLDQEINARYKDIHSFLIVRHGYLVFERYFKAYSQEDRHPVASVTKSFISALVGIAIDRGFMESVQQPMLDFFPEYFPTEGDYLKKQITVQNLLTMTAGFQWRSGPRANEQLIDRLRRSKDWVSFILDLQVQGQSFGNFQYNSANSHLLSAIITRCTGRCAAEFAADHLFDPLGMDKPPGIENQSFTQTDVFRNKSGGWPKDPQGNSIGGWGLALKTRDLARFGFLYLNDGQWDDKQVIPQNWIEDSFYPYTPEYGYQWWLRHVDGVSTFSAAGQGGNHVICVPQEDLVVVVTSKVNARWQDRWLLVEQYVFPALTG